MHTSLYMGGTYQDADLNTIKGRDAELAAVALRYREEYMDMWRTSDPWHAGRDARIGGRILKSLVRAHVFVVVGGVDRI